jgi:AraC-like DNA-binding protein
MGDNRMRDPATLPLLTPELLLGTDPLPPPPPGPVRFAVDHWPEREQPTLVRECFARLGFKYDIERLPDVPFCVDVSLNMVSSLLMSNGRIYGSRNRRTRAHCEDDADDAVLIINTGGQHLIEQRDRELVLGDGEAVLVSSADPSCYTHSPPSRMLGLRFAKAHVASLMQNGHDSYMRRIPSDTQALRLLRTYVKAGWDHCAGAPADLQHLMAGHVYDLIAVMAGATRDAEEAANAGGGLRAARLCAIKQDIGRHLDRSDLSVAALAERHGCTPRLVQRMFEAEGSTFTEYVLGERLGRAYRLLGDPRRRADKISAVALDCGFGDVSYFNRMFRRRYGTAPSDVRAQAQRDPATGARRDN